MTRPAAGTTAAASGTTLATGNGAPDVSAAPAVPQR
jgi:hypothetical protein